MIGPGHGGDILRKAHRLGIAAEDLLDFSASINPLGTPPAVLEAARSALAQVRHYPEIDALSLVEALAAHHDLPAANLLPGSGATELLALFPEVFRPRRALLVTPAFSEYARNLRRVGTIIDSFALRPEQNFALSVDALLQAVKPDTDLLLLANPGNPTGVAIEAPTLLELTRRIPQRTMIAVDEAFIDFTPQRSIISRVNQHPHLYVFRSLTKFYAIAGLRAGYMAGPADGIARLSAAKAPWSLSTPAIAAAKACLTEAAHRQRTLVDIPVLREQFAADLATLGCHVFPSSANYLLLRLPGESPDADQLSEALLAERVLVRPCGNFPPLDNRYLRVAVRSRDENKTLIRALQKTLAFQNDRQKKINTFQRKDAKDK